MRGAFGARAVSIATTVDAGRYSPDIAPALEYLSLQPVAGIRVADFDSTTAIAPAPAASVEAAMAARGLDRALVDLRPFIGTPPVLTRTLDYTRGLAFDLALWRGFDGLLFIRRTHGLNEPLSIP